MTRKNCTQESVAKALGVSQAAVSRRLRGTVDFTVTELAIVAELLEVPAATLFAEQVRSAS